MIYILHVHPQRSNQDYLQTRTVTASDQGYSNNTQSSTQAPSQRLNIQAHSYDTYVTIHTCKYKFQLAMQL